MILLADIKLTGDRAIAWSPPRTFQGGKPGGKRWWVHEKDKHLKAWQDALRAAHREAYGREPYLGPVMLVMTFHRQTKDARLWGKRWWTPKSVRGMADRVNLEKAAEDALTTFRQYKLVKKGEKKERVLVLEMPGVFANDSQATDSFSRKRWAEHDGVEIKVYGLEEDEE